MKQAQAEAARWARGLALHTSAKPRDWEIGVTLGATGELPTEEVSEKGPWFRLMVLAQGYWIILVVPLERGRGRLVSQLRSWNAKDERWFSYVRAGSNPPKPDKTLTPPKSLASVRSWLTAAEQKLGVRFRRDRPLIQSNLKGGAKAMQAWILET